jgi:uncharacterized protein YfaP (DUF2135 family)
VAWNYALQQAVEQEVAKWTASPITIMAGAVPLVFVPELVLNVGASASVDASLSTGYEQTFDYWTSLTWESESELWSKTQDVNKQFSYSPPSLDASISAEAYLKPQLDILLYGLAGPKASTKGYLSFDADIDECPWWSLDLGIDVLVGIAPGVFSDDIEYNLPAFQLVAPYEIASADSCFTGGGDTTTTTTSITGSDYGTIAGNIKDAANNQPVSGVNVTVYNASNSVLGSGYSDSSGSYSIDVISGTGYKVVYTKIGYFTTTNNNVTVTANTTTNLEAALVIDESYSGTGSISGTVTDATTGTGLGGVSLCLREGMGSKSGSCVASTTTDSSGAYSFSSINAGVYTVEATKSGYITGHFTVACLGGTTTTDQNGSISPALSSDEYRIVLTWGESPSDLDSHLFGPTSTGVTFHISWEGKVADNGYVNLDVDDIYSYGPETITISRQLDGTYRYLVHDYTNYASSSSTALANSGAQVNVYKGSALVATFNVPSGAGTLWTVFELNDDDKTPIDTITGDGPPYSMRVLTRGNRVKTIEIGAPWFMHVPEKSR